MRKLSKKEILNDYRIANESRQLSILGRREVLTGKAKFGIFGDGKEVPQLAMAKVFKDGDWRSGYYRDQTFMLATGMMSLEEFFAQLYGNTDIKAHSGGGRMMNNHFATRTLDDNGEWKDLTAQKNSSADISPTAGQMPRLLGLALASKIFRNNPGLENQKQFSNNGNEVAFGTIGDASTSEGIFFETINAAGVLKVPMAISIWDDAYGISVPKKYQTTKENISEILKGFEKDDHDNGFLIYKEKGWDYIALCIMYDEGIKKCRKEHIPVMFHVDELTQPQGHSTSGSHERYKSNERLQWEAQFDGIKKMREWIISEGIADEAELDQIEAASVVRAKEARKKAWESYIKPIRQHRDDFLRMVDISTCNCAKTSRINAIKQELAIVGDPNWKDIMSSGKRILRLICDNCSNPQNSLKKNVMSWRDQASKNKAEDYNSFLWSNSKHSVM
ncbi:MAG: thiamine pyrophosphate-dependent dehydrogenase E1 component subunit alpha, partial [Bacteroidota bacterium]|nr:thiamine pyrophosphate-dependent dehydrogenase E1 component subunit alpha [Bacteroidota bacterium]